MRLEIFTLALDAMPWIACHLPVFNALTVPWRWTIVHGVAANAHDTAWMQPQAPRLSTDGTTEFLAGLRSHPRITVLERPMWDGKRAMCNAALGAIEARGVRDALLLEVDADELWTATQLGTLATWFEHDPGVAAARFRCTYHVGLNIVTTTDDAYGCNPGEWLRAWRWHSGMRFLTHEPPNLAGNQGRILTRDETAAGGLVFDHYAYALPSQVAYKERVYGYRDALRKWQRLQANTRWPVRLRDFLPWVDERATADLLIKPTTPTP
jgi:hypothetical protein